jgi:hypothetical protein
MPPNNTSNTPNAPTQPNARWSDADKAILLRVLKEQKDKYGNQSGAGWKRPVWTAVETAIQMEGILVNGTGPKTWNKCQDHYGTVCLRNFPLWIVADFQIFN